MDKETKITSIVIKMCEEEDDDKKVLKIVASDETVDRDGDIIRAKGWDFENYVKNGGIMLAVHNWRGEPVAKANKVYVEDGQLILEDIKFADTEDGEKYKYLVENGFLKTVSVGFIPKKAYFTGNEESVDEMKSIDPEWIDKNIEKLAKAKRVIWEAELLEVSFVPVPANPNAMVVMASKGFETAWVFDESGNKIEIDLTNYEVKNPIPPSVHPRNMVYDDSSAWDKDKAIRSLRKWASSDGSGNKETIDWTKYRKGFAWYDANVPENFGSYKLPHHWIDDNGNFVTVWRGVVSAMASLMGARGGLNIPADDKRGVYNHLAGHYRKFGKEPPKFSEAGYTFEEALKEFDEELLTEYIKQFPEEVIEYTKNSEEKIIKLTEKIDELEKQIKSSSDVQPESPCSKEGHVECSDSGKIALSEEELKEAISVAVEKFTKTFMGGK